MLETNMDLNRFRRWSSESTRVHSRLGDVRAGLLEILENTLEQPSINARQEITRIYMRVCEAYELAGLWAQAERITLERILAALEGKQ